MFQINLKILKCLHALNKNLFIFLYIFFSFFSWGPGWGGGAYQHFKALCNNYWHRKVKNKDHNLYFKILQRLQEPSRSKYFKMTTATHVSFFLFLSKKTEIKKDYNTSGNTTLNICVCKIFLCTYTNMYSTYNYEWLLDRFHAFRPCICSTTRFLSLHTSPCRRSLLFWSTWLSGSGIQFA